MDRFKDYLKSISHKPQLSESESMEKIEQIAAIKMELIEQNLKLVALIARNLHKQWPEFDLMDFIQEGNISLINSVSMFDAAKGIKFSLFASYRIKQDIITFIKNNKGPVNIFKTREQRTVLNNLTKIKERLEKFSVETVANSYNVSESSIGVAIDSNKYVAVESIADSSVNKELIIESPEQLYVRNEESEVLIRKIKEFRDSLTPIKRAVFYDCMYTGEKSMADIGREFSISRERVRQHREDVIKRAKEYFGDINLKTLFG